MIIFLISWLVIGATLACIDWYKTFGKIDVIPLLYGMMAGPWMVLVVLYNIKNWRY
jgi:hypothetical protein